MKEKVKKFFKTLKHIFGLALTFFVLIAGLRLIQLRQHSGFLALSVSKMLELQLTNLETGLVESAKSFDALKASRSTKKISPEVHLANLKEVMTFNPALDEILWVGANGKSVYGYSRSDEKVMAEDQHADLKNTPAFQTAQKGNAMVLPIAYGSKQVPYFQIRYPLADKTGDFLLMRVNLWEFLKEPTVLAKELLGQGFDLALIDGDGKVLAHKDNNDGLSRFVTGIFRISKDVRRLSCRVEVVPNQEGLWRAVDPRRFIWIVLGLASALVVLF